MRSKASKVSEADLQRQILEWLQLKRVFAWRSNTGAMVAESKGKRRFVRFGMPGMADIMGMWMRSTFYQCKCGETAHFKHAIPLAIEVKSAKGKLSLAQESFRDAVKLNGGLYILARSLDDVINAMGGRPQ